MDRNHGNGDHLDTMMSEEIDMVMSMDATGIDTAAAWAAIVDRNATPAQSFVYAVQTTGVYCRPACPSRQPRRENVSFFPSGTDATEAGFRPCKRCRPDEASTVEHHIAAVRQACELLRTCEDLPHLADLATQVGLSPSHFHRIFKRMVGVTPKAYARTQRQNRLMDDLATGTHVTRAIVDAGYRSMSRLYETSSRDLGMAPSRVRAGGDGETIRSIVVETAIGWMLIGATESGICAVEFGDRAIDLDQRLVHRFPAATIVAADDDLRLWASHIAAFVAAPGALPDLPIEIRGTAFQARVWDVLRRVPVGQTATYSTIARAIGQPTAARAVAQACASNNIAVLIPCHRIVRADGDIGGYRWGTDRKRALLAAEVSECASA